VVRSDPDCDNDRNEPTMTPQRVPAWKKWLMLAFAVGFLAMAALVHRMLQSARDWDPNRPRSATTTPAR